MLGTSAQKVDPALRLTEMGVDSLMAVELQTIVKRDFGVSLPLASLLEGSSVAQLTGIVLEQMAFDASPKPGQTPQATVSPPLQNAVESASMVQVAADPSNQLVDGTPSDASILEPTTTVGEVSELAHAAANMAASLPPSRPVKPVQAEAPGSASARGETAIDSGSINSRWTPLQKFVKRALAAFFRLVARVEVAGLDNIPRSGRVLLACNHLSMIDLPLIATILPRRGAVMAADRLQALPWVRWFLDLGDRIYIRRSEADQEALSQGLAVLRRGNAWRFARGDTQPDRWSDARPLRRRLPGPRRRRHRSSRLRSMATNRSHAM